MIKINIIIIYGVSVALQKYLSKSPSSTQYSIIIRIYYSTGMMMSIRYWRRSGNIVVVGKLLAGWWWNEVPSIVTAIVSNTCQLVMKSIRQYYTTGAFHFTTSEWTVVGTRPTCRLGLNSRQGIISDDISMHRNQLMTIECSTHINIVLPSP